MTGNCDGRVGGRPTASNCAPAASAAPAATVRNRSSSSRRSEVFSTTELAVSTWQLVSSSCSSTPSRAARSATARLSATGAPVDGSTSRNSSSTPRVGVDPVEDATETPWKKFDPARRSVHNGPDHREKVEGINARSASDSNLRSYDRFRGQGFPVRGRCHAGSLAGVTAGGGAPRRGSRVRRDARARPPRWPGAVPGHDGHRADSSGATGRDIRRQLGVLPAGPAGPRCRRVARTVRGPLRAGARYGVRQRGIRRCRPAVSQRG